MNSFCAPASPFGEWPQKVIPSHRKCRARVWPHCGEPFTCSEHLLPLQHPPALWRISVRGPCPTGTSASELLPSFKMCSSFLSSYGLLWKKKQTTKKNKKTIQDNQLFNSYFVDRRPQNMQTTRWNQKGIKQLLILHITALKGQFSLFPAPNEVLLT